MQDKSCSSKTGYFGTSIVHTKLCMVLCPCCYMALGMMALDRARWMHPSKPSKTPRLVAVMDRKQASAIVQLHFSMRPAAMCPQWCIVHVHQRQKATVHEHLRKAWTDEHVPLMLQFPMPNVISWGNAAGSAQLSGRVPDSLLTCATSLVSNRPLNAGKE